jgi:hypothetical protein
MLEFLQTNAHRDEDCLIWAGAVDNSGYPKVQWQGRSQSARRLLLTLRGRPPKGRQVAYATCGNLRCMSDEHLRGGPRLHAYAAATKNGGNRPGVHRSLAVARSKAERARMGYRNAPEVLRLIEMGAKHADIAQRFGVHKSQVGHAMKAWARMGITPMSTRMAA